MVRGAAAALPALTAAPAAAVAPHADAELLKLGVELEGVIQEWRAQAAKGERRSAQREAAYAAAGLPHRRYKDFENPEEWRAYIDKLNAVPVTYAPGDEDPHDEHGHSIAWDGIHDQLYPLVEDILEHTAKTNAGLVVQTRAWHLGDEDMFEEYSEGKYSARYLKAVYRFLKVEPLDLSQS
jgi:hypothetical protein